MAQDEFAHLIALLQNGADGAGLALVGGALHHGVFQAGIEGLSQPVDHGDAALFQGFHQLLVHQLHAGEQAFVRAFLGQGPLQVIHHGQQALDEFPGAVLEGLGAGGLGALAVIIEIRLHALGQGQVFLGFGFRGGLAFFAGVLISVITRLDLATAITMSVTIAACIILVPKMVGLLMEGLVPVSNAARKFFKSHLGDDYDIYIGMDEALYLGDEVGIQCSVIMIPIALALAF